MELKQEYLNRISQCVRESEIEDLNKYMYTMMWGVPTLKRGYTDGIVMFRNKLDLDEILQECKLLKDKNVTRCPFLAAFIQSIWYVFDYDLKDLSGIILNSDKYFTFIDLSLYPDMMQELKEYWQKYRKTKANKDGVSPSSAWTIPNIRDIVKKWDSTYSFFSNIRLINRNFNIEDELTNIVTMIMK